MLLNNSQMKRLVYILLAGLQITGCAKTLDYSIEKPVATRPDDAIVILGLKTLSPPADPVPAVEFRDVNDGTRTTFAVLPGLNFYSVPPGIYTLAGIATHIRGPIFRRPPLYSFVVGPKNVLYLGTLGFDFIYDDSTWTKITQFLVRVPYDYRVKVVDEFDQAKTLYAERSGKHAPIIEKGLMKLMGRVQYKQHRRNLSPR